MPTGKNSFDLTGFFFQILDPVSKQVFDRKLDSIDSTSELVNLNCIKKNVSFIAKLGRSRR